MNKLPFLLFAGGLLAACGGSGTPAVDDTPDTPDVPVDVTPEPVVEPPEPVNFVFDTTDKIELSQTADTFVVNGVTYDISDFYLTYTRDNAEFFLDSSFYDSDNDNYIFAARIMDDDASAATLVTVPKPIVNLGSDPSQPGTTTYAAAPDGAVYSVPALTGIPSGTATFTGQYAGFFVVRLQNSTARDRVRMVSVGDVALEVEFDQFLSQSAFSGSITNREARRNDGTPEAAIILNDVIIENGRFDDTGQITGDVSGGEWQFINGLEIYNDAYQTVAGTLSGQLGGSDGYVIAGAVTLEQYEYYIVDYDGTFTDQIDRIVSEVGVFTARQD